MCWVWFQGVWLVPWFCWYQQPKIPLMVSLAISKGVWTSLQLVMQLGKVTWEWERMCMWQMGSCMIQMAWLHKCCEISVMILFKLKWRCEPEVYVKTYMRPSKMWPHRLPRIFSRGLSVKVSWVWLKTSMVVEYIGISTTFEITFILKLFRVWGLSINITYDSRRSSRV